MNKKEGLTRRDFLKTALIAAGRVAVGNIDMPEWVEEFDEPSIEELAKICTKVLSDIEVAEVLQQPDLGTALGYTFSLLIQHGEDPEQYLIGKNFLQGTIEEKKEKTYAFPIEQLMVSLEDREMIESTKIETYPQSVLNEVNAGKLRKLRISTSLIPLPRLSHINPEKVPWLELNLQMINELEEIKGPTERVKILATILEWEKENGLNVKQDGVIGTIF